MLIEGLTTPPLVLSYEFSRSFVAGGVVGKLSLVASQACASWGFTMQLHAGQGAVYQ